MRPETISKISQIAAEKGVLRAEDVVRAGIRREYLWQLCREGKLERVKRGVYRLAEMHGADITEHHSLAETARAAPQTVVCLLSALRFHDITTQMPFEVWLAIGQKARRPKIENAAVRFVYLSEKSLTAGVEEHRIENVAVKIYSPAKTVADCFKFRNKIGLDVALEALREVLQNRRATRDEIWSYAKICRVTRVMRPYLEAMT